jgi:hypothetical protein
MEVAGDMFELELIKKEGECGELGPQHTFAIRHSPPERNYYCCRNWFSGDVESFGDP